MIKREQIDKGFYLEPGQRVELYFRWRGLEPGLTDAGLYTRALQWAYIENRLQEKHPEFEVISYVDGAEFLVVTVEIQAGQITSPQMQQAGFAGTVKAVAIATVLLGGLYLVDASLERVERIYEVKAETLEQLTKSPEGRAAIAGTGAAGFALLGLVIYLFWRK